jgi:putative phosphoribosyl transferase
MTERKMFSRFANRAEAGRLLATELKEYANLPNVVVLALPRGGVPVGYEIAKALHTPLDTIIVRKLGVPKDEELAFGAIASGGVQFFNEAIISKLRLPEKMLTDIVERELFELNRREIMFKGESPKIDIKGKIVILVDDGLVTGATMHAAVSAVKIQEPAQIIVAVPVALQITSEHFKIENDVQCICLATPEPLYSLGLYYRDFTQITDEEVQCLLHRAAKEREFNNPANRK